MPPLQFWWIGISLPGPWCRYPAQPSSVACSAWCHQGTPLWPANMKNSFSKLLANASNTLSDDTWSSADICSLQGLPSISCLCARKEENCINLGLLWGVSHCVVKLQSGGEVFPCCRLVLSMPIHPGKHLWWYWYAGHCSLCENLDISLWEGVMVLKWESLQGSLKMFQMAHHLLDMCRWLYCTCLPSLKWFRPVPLIPEWYFRSEYFTPERIFHFGRVCWSWKDWIVWWLTEGSTELATGYWEGVCYLLLTWEGLMYAWNWRLNKPHTPFTVLRDLYALKAN